jgi:hypothetical protein
MGNKNTNTKFIYPALSSNVIRTAIIETFFTNRDRVATKCVIRSRFKTTKSITVFTVIEGTYKYEWFRTRAHVLRVGMSDISYNAKHGESYQFFIAQPSLSKVV